MYDVAFSPTAERQFDDLENAIQERIIKTLERARIRPQMHAKKLVGSSAYRIRAGDYRLIIDIDQQNSSILVLKVGHRKNVYDY